MDIYSHVIAPMRGDAAAQLDAACDGWVAERFKAPVLKFDRQPPQANRSVLERYETYDVLRSVIVR
jgi:hypothetical protein